MTDRQGRFARFLEQSGYLPPKQSAAPPPRPVASPVGTARPSYVAPVPDQTRPAMANPMVQRIVQAAAAQRTAPVRMQRFAGGDVYEEQARGEDYQQVYGYQVPQGADGGEDTRRQVQAEFAAYQAEQRAKQTAARTERVGGDRPTVVGPNAPNADERRRREDAWIAEEGAAEETRRDANAEYGSRYDRLDEGARQRRIDAEVAIQARLEAERAETDGLARGNVGQGRPEVPAALAEDPNRVVVDANTEPPPGIGSSTYYTLEIDQRQDLWDQYSQSVTRGETVVGAPQPPTTGDASGFTSAITSGAGFIGDTAEAFQAAKSGNLDPAKELASTTGKAALTTVLAITDAPRVFTVSDLGEGMYFAATHGGDLRGRDEFGTMEMVEWAALPENAAAVRAAYEQGYNGFSGDRAVWELWVGQQPAWKRAFYDVILDPTNYAAGAGGVGDNLIRTGSNMAADAARGSGDAAVGETLVLIGKLIKSPQDVMDRTVDAPFNALGDLVGRIPDRLNPFAASDNAARAEAVEGVESAEALERRVLANERAGYGPNGPQQMPTPDAPVSPTTGTGRPAVVPDFQGTAVPNTRTGQVRLDPSRVDAPNESPAADPTWQPPVETPAARGVTTRRTAAPEMLTAEEQAVAVAREQRRRAAYDALPQEDRDFLARAAPSADGTSWVDPETGRFGVVMPASDQVSPRSVGGGRKADRWRSIFYNAESGDALMLPSGAKVKPKDVEEYRRLYPDTVAPTRPIETFDDALPSVTPDATVAPDPWKAREDPRTWEGPARQPQRNTLKTAGYSLPDENLGFLDPSYKRKADMWEAPTPNEQAAFIFGRDDAAAGKGYWDEITPVTKAHMAQDDALRALPDAEQAWFSDPFERQGTPGVSNPAMESAERTLNRLRFEAQQEVVFSKHFGPNPNPYPFERSAPVGTRAMENAVFADDPAIAARAEGVLRQVAQQRGIQQIGGQPVEEVVAELRALRASLGYDAISPPPAAVAPDMTVSGLADETAAAPGPPPDIIPEAPFADEIDGPGFLAADTFDEAHPASLRAHAVDGTPDTLNPDGSRNTGTATRARERLRNHPELGIGNQAVRDLGFQRVNKYGVRDVRHKPDKFLRTGAYAKNTPRTTHFREAGYVGPGLEAMGPQASPADVLGITPFGQARDVGVRAGRATRDTFESTVRAAKEKANDAREALGVPALADDIAPSPAKPGDRPSLTARNKGTLAADEYEALTARVTIPAGTKVDLPEKLPNGKPKTTTITGEWSGSYEDRFELNLAKLRDADATKGRTAKNARKRNPQTAALADPFTAAADDDLVEQALALTTAEFKAVYVKAPSSMPKPLRALFSAPDKLTKLIRENLQFNRASGFGAFMQDTVSNAYVATITGNGGALTKLPRTFAKAWRAGDAYDEVVDVERGSARLGIATPKKYISATVGREQVERSEKLYLERLGDATHTRLLTDFVADPRMKNLRQQGDSAMRVSTFHNYVGKEVPISRARFVKSADALADKLGKPELSDRARALGRRFSPDDVRAMTADLGITDDTLARAWRREMRDLEKRATKETDRIFFTYKQTRVDEKVSKVFMFHYYMTRATALHARTALQHPGLLHAYVSAWQAADENTDENLPGWMRGYLKFMGDTGAGAGFFDPLSVFLPFTMFRDAAGEGFDERGIEKVLRTTGLFVSPMIQTAGAMAGLLSKGNDPTGTQAIRGLAQSTMDWARNNGYDLGFGTGLTGDPLKDLENRVYNETSALAEEHGVPFAEALELPDPDALAIGKVRGILVEQYVEEYGPVDTWTPEEHAAFVRSEIALNEGAQGDPMVDEALETYADIELTQDLANVGSPADVRVRYGPTDERRRLAGEFYDAGGYDQETPDPAQKNAADEAQAIKGGEADSLILNMEADQYRGMGTEFQQGLASVWNTIVYDELPVGSSAVIGGRTYTAAQVNAMTEDERKRIADDWVADQGPGATETLATHRGERKEFRDNRDLYGDYAAYQGYVGDFAGGAAAFRAQVLATESDSEFALALGRKREELERYDTPAAEIEPALDAWVRSPEGYQAAMGIQSSLYETGTADPLWGMNEEPWRLELAPVGPGAGGGSGSGTGTRRLNQTMASKRLAGHLTRPTGNRLYDALFGTPLG